MRSGDSIQIANTKERLAIQDVKSFRYAESMKANPVTIGGIVGALVGGSVANAYSARGDQPILQRRFISTIYAIIGGVFGALLGNTYRSILRMRREVQTIPKRWRIPVISASMTLSFSFIYVVQRQLRQLLSRLNSNS
jgi:hypothetical protein